jgi:hypothetical protein
MILNGSILVISDTHIPYHHPDALDFLSDLRRQYKPDRIIHIGDEVDNHAISFHDSDSDLKSAGDELVESRKYIKQLEKLFPVMDIMESNHGSLLYRKALSHGIPRSMLKSYNEILEVSDSWKWHRDLMVRLPNKQPVYFCHGKNKNVTTLSQRMGMSAVQGHFHGRFKIEYWGNPERLNWAMNIGCLADSDSLAMAYSKNELERPVIGCGLIIDSLPVLEPLVMNKNARWIHA